MLNVLPVEIANGLYAATVESQNMAAVATDHARRPVVGDLPDTKQLCEEVASLLVQYTTLSMCPSLTFPFQIDADSYQPKLVYMPIGAAGQTLSKISPDGLVLAGTSNLLNALQAFVVNSRKAAEAYSGELAEAIHGKIDWTRVYLPVPAYSTW
jgi:hypothetical protein